MKALLDTHVLLWFVAGDTRLPRDYRQLLQERGHELILSAASAAEISTKFVRGKLTLPQPPTVFIPQVINDLRLLPLSVSIEHGLAVSELPLHHADPFDRLLIAQAMQEDIPIITGDKDIRRYDVKTIW